MVINEIYYNYRYDSLAIYSSVGGIGIIINEDHWFFVGFYKGKL
tara:strand:+ start:76 stop:207 length:132 start_codon:yes stop_codon:yes gene_type:complete